MATQKETQEKQQVEVRRGEQQPSQAVQTTPRQGEQPTGIARRSALAPSLWTGSPFSFMRRFSEEMDRLFEDFGFGSSLLTPSLSTFGRGLLPRTEFTGALWSPQIDMFRRGDQLVVRADLPGLTKEDVNVEVRGDQLVLQGERRQEREEGRPEGAYYRSERRYGSFYRSIPLPEGVNADNVNATFRNGVLEVTMPAPQEARGRRIEIQS